MPIMLEVSCVAQNVYNVRDWTASCLAIWKCEHGAREDLLDGGCVSYGVDAALGAQHPAVLVCDNASEVRLGALRKALLHMQNCESLRLSERGRS